MATPKLPEMRQKLERWKSHNEVNAKPADGILYEFLNDFLSLLEQSDDDSSSENKGQDDTQKERKISLTQAGESGLANRKKSKNRQSEDNAQINATDDADDTGGSAPPPDKGRG